MLFLFLGLPGVILAALLTGALVAGGAQRRRDEQALLRTRGLTPRAVAGFAAAEAILVGLAGGAIGLALAAVAALVVDALRRGRAAPRCGAGRLLGVQPGQLLARPRPRAGSDDLGLLLGVPRAGAVLARRRDAPVAGRGARPTVPSMASMAAAGWVAHVEPIQHRFAYVGADLQDLCGVHPGSIMSATALQAAYFQGGTAAALMRTLAARPDPLLVSDETVKDFPLRPGDLINLRLPDRTTQQLRTVPFHYAGIVKEFPTAPKKASSSRTPTTSPGSRAAMPPHRHATRTVGCGRCAPSPVGQRRRRQRRHPGPRPGRVGSGRASRRSTWPG